MFLSLVYFCRHLLQYLTKYKNLTVYNIQKYELFFLIQCNNSENRSTKRTQRLGI